MTDEAPEITPDDVEKKLGAEEVASLLKSVDTVSAAEVDALADRIAQAAVAQRSKAGMVKAVLSALQDAPSIVRAIAAIA